MHINIIRFIFIKLFLKITTKQKHIIYIWKNTKTQQNIGVTIEEVVVDVIVW